MIQAKLTPTQKKNKFVLGDVFLGLQNGNFGTELQGWHDHGSISAIDVNTGKRVWKFTTPAAVWTTSHSVASSTHFSPRNSQVADLVWQPSKAS